MRKGVSIFSFTLIILVGLACVCCDHFVASADASAQIAYGANLAQMRPPIDDYAFEFNASIPPQYGVDWLREAAFVDPKYGPNFTELYNQYAPFGYNWELRFDIQGVSDLYGSNWTLPQWDSYVTDVVNAFPKVHVWEVGNEVLSGQAQYNNGYLVQGGNLTLAYFNILKDAYTIVKQHDPSDTVIAFGGQDIFDPAEIALYNAGNFQKDASYELAAQVWADGASNYCDAISLHAYGDNTGAAWLLNETPAYNGVTSKLTLQQLWSAVITEYEQLTGKPVWFTETGEPIDSPPNDPTPPVLANSLQKQAAFLDQSFSFLSSFSFTRAIFWFKLVGPSQYYNNSVLLYTTDDGLFNQDGTPRLATLAFQSFSSTISPTPSPTTQAPTFSPTPIATLTPTISPQTSTSQTTAAPSTLSSGTPEPSASVTATGKIPELKNSLQVLAVIILATTAILLARRKLFLKTNPERQISAL